MELTCTDEEVDAVLRRARLLVYKHPIAAQALFRALVAEGRRVAQTPGGLELQAQLTRSALVQRARSVWEAGTMKVLSADSDALIPSAIVEAIAAAARRAALEPGLAKTFEDVDLLRDRRG